MGVYKVESITHSGRKGTRGEARIDKMYPSMVGGKVMVNTDNIFIGLPFVMRCLGNGDADNGYNLRCSTVKELHMDSHGNCTIETNNTIYCLKEEG